MRLEGTLDAFSLPDIFQLLSFTQKTGTLHLRREGAHGAVHLRAGSVTGGRADVLRQELGRRLLGTGLVDDEVLAAAAEELAGDPTLSLAQLLAEKGRLDVDTVRDLAAEQAHDAVFSLLRWPDGEFAFVVDETDPDDLGALLPVEQVVAEGQRRLAGWGALVESVPAPDVVVVVNASPDTDPALTREEWALLSFVDGRRTVADLVALSGRGEYAVVSALAGLVSRRLLVVRAGAEQDRLVGRQSLLTALEGGVVEVPASAGAPPSAQPGGRRAGPPAPVVPEQGAREQGAPAAPPSRPAAASPAFARTTPPSGAFTRPTGAGAGAHGSVDGATALAPDPVGADPAAIERDPSLNRSLLLRLIAGVRGL